jgi:hypothetical protein
MSYVNDADPDPNYHFDADADMDPRYCIYCTKISFSNQINWIQLFNTVLTKIYKNSTHN